MAAIESAAAFLPDRLSMASLRAAASSCTACPLHLTGTQTVFGEGPARARIVLVGEQPGDREDLEATRSSDRPDACSTRRSRKPAIDRASAYLTNVVKHFKWQARGKRRIHQKPNAAEIAACRPWLDAELAVLKPQALACLGATAAQALLGRQFRVTKDRGRLLETPLAPLTLATVHPSSILRAPDEEARRRERALFVEDLRVAAEALAKS